MVPASRHTSPLARPGYVAKTFIRSQEAATTHLRSYFDQPRELSRYLAAERLVAGGDLSQERGGRNRGVGVWQPQLGVRVKPASCAQPTATPRRNEVMTEITRHFDVPEPLPTGELRLPGNSGVVKVKIKAIEQRRDDVWVLVEAPRWDRWRTQIHVGEQTHEGISPGHEDVWAPSFAVSADSGVYQRLRSLYLAAA